MSKELLAKVLDCGWVDMTKQTDGSFYLVIDGGAEITEAEAQTVWETWGEVFYITIEENESGQMVRVPHKEPL